MPHRSSDDGLTAIRDRATAEFPEAGWSVRTRTNAAPALSSNIERFSQFLTLVGLTALVVGGVGVANAVRAYLDGKRGVIATFKSLGASGGFVFLVYLVQIMLIAALGIVIGLVVGAAMPFVAGALLSSVIPVPAEGGIYPAALAMAALFGFLVTLAFALMPLGRARDVPATALFREMGFEGRGLPRLAYIAAAGLIALALAGLAIWFSDDRRIALIFVGATIFAFIVLRGVGVGVQWLARRSPRVRSTALRLAIGNIHRPGALTAVGGAVARPWPDAAGHAGADRRRSAPADLGKPDRARAELLLRRHPGCRGRRFDALIGKEAPTGKLVKVPMLRGRVMAINGVEAQKLKVPPEGAWVLRGDRGLTYADAVPENATLDSGRMVAEGLFRRAAGLVLGRGRQGDRPEARRHHHRQRARPQRDGQDRQFPHRSNGNR